MKQLPWARLLAAQLLAAQLLAAQLLAAQLLAATLLVASPARAEGEPRQVLALPEPAQPERTDSPLSLRWQHRTFSAWDGAIVASAAGAMLTGALLSPPSEPRLEGGIWFDDPVRDALRADSRAGRDRAKAVGDLFYLSGALAPTMIDNLVVTLWLRRAPDVAMQMLLINLEAYSVAGALLIGSEKILARARPSMRPCERDGNYEAYCGNADQTSSLISGHTGVVATSAGLICAHHQYLRLYANDVADTLACATGIGMALTTGIARLINDRHYATDILAAFGVGALSGYALPVLGYYLWPAQGQAAAGWWVFPDVTQTSAGVRFLHPL